MAVIYLRHPVHGAKVAFSDMEAINDLHHGWEEFDPNEPPEPAVEPVEPVVTVSVPNALRAPRKRRESKPGDA